MVQSIFKPNANEGLARRIANRLRFFGSQRQFTALESPPGGLTFLQLGSSVYVCGNLAFDGTSWNLGDTSQPGIIYIFNTAGISVYTATAGVNPRPLTGPTTITPVMLNQLLSLGNLGATAATNRTTNLVLAASTITNLLTLAIPVGKWLVFGQAIFTTNAAGGTCDVAIQGQHWSFNTIAVPINTTAMVDCKPVVLTGPTTATLQGYSNVAATCQWVSGAVGSDVTGLYAVQVGV